MFGNVRNVARGTLTLTLTPTVVVNPNLTVRVMTHVTQCVLRLTAEDFERSGRHFTVRRTSL